MKARVMNSLGSSIANLHVETMEWIKEAQFYLDEIEIFQRLIHNKQIPDRVGEQISKDVDLNLNTMADKIHKDVVRRLRDHESYLHSLINPEFDLQKEQCDEKHNALATIVKNLKVAVGDLKAQVQKFMLQKEFGVRASTL